MEEQSLFVITGAAGFIGSACVRELNDRGLDNLVLVDDIGQTEKWKNLLGKHFDDFVSKEALFDWLDAHSSRVKGIIHLGACSDTLETDGDYVMETNYRYTQNLCKLAVQKGIRFVYASSAATYGDGSQGFCDDVEGLEALRPLNLYGFSKHCFDLWAKRHGLFAQIVGLKYFNVFGPNEGHKGHMASLVYKLFPQVRGEGVVHLFKSTDRRFEDGQQCRDFIYIKDAARLTVDFLFNAISGMFNIGRGEPTTWNELATALFRALNKKVNISYVEMPQNLAGQYQNYTCADMDRFLRSHQKPLQTMDVYEAVEDYVKEHLLTGRCW